MTSVLVVVAETVLAVPLVKGADVVSGTTVLPVPVTIGALEVL